MRSDSWNAYLSTFMVGERRYVETTLDGYSNTMRNLNKSVTRRPEATKQWVFVTELFTAVSNARAGDIRYLVAVERTA